MAPSSTSPATPACRPFRPRRVSRRTRAASTRRTSSPRGSRTSSTPTGARSPARRPQVRRPRRRRRDVPFFRYPDRTSSPEMDYIPPVAPTPLRGQPALRLRPGPGRIRLRVALRRDVQLPDPRSPVGRLVETATETSGMINAYSPRREMASFRRRRPRSSRATTSSAMARARSRATSKRASVTSGGATASANHFNVPAPRAWTGAQIKTELIGDAQRPDLHGRPLHREHRHRGRLSRPR